MFLKEAKLQKKRYQKCLEKDEAAIEGNFEEIIGNGNESFSEELLRKIVEIEARVNFHSLKMNEAIDKLTVVIEDFGNEKKIADRYEAMKEMEFVDAVFYVMLEMKSLWIVRSNLEKQDENKNNDEVDDDQQTTEQTDDENNNNDEVDDDLQATIENDEVQQVYEETDDE